MKKTSAIFTALGAALLFAGCAADEERTGYGTGYLSFAVETASVVADVQTRAVPAGYVELPANVLPSVDKFRLALSGTYLDNSGKPTRFDQTWDPFETYSSDYPLECLESNYTATFTYGSETAEGPKAPFFQQTVGNIHLKPDTTTKQPVTISLSNSCFRLLLDPSMTEYYADITLTISTVAGNRFTFTPANATTQNIIFIRTGQQLTLEGSATHAASGQKVSFPSQVINDGHPTQAGTMHTITLRADGVGGVKIGISFDSSFEEVKTDDIYIG